MGPTDVEAADPVDVRNQQFSRQQIAPLAGVVVKDYTAGITEESERLKLREEIDGLVAHLYGLTEEELMHILTMCPLTPDPVKVATLNAYRDVERGLIK